ncbi:chromate transporter [Breznakia sp. PF5-3]|uniref:chromate transporter n=1 Tax=unclassified Breznakia TaxID=2623764 RepID=UPI0024051AD6|nr:MULTISPECIES: chromate transporter [unclassified Breznakia]MDF9823841.1 chromate transporter [Breznakia sp. PM6-1]MDF9834593.1 chromate transporter [Breznakia sp. PF5-3]MDF9836790.1 chromate transporter [Breznakia sp. PFB2-8]MDF9858761.1 chromate transporter [Breznakia sp. PH5-24]
MMILLVTLFVRFLQIGTLSFGGGYAVIPLIQELILDDLGWLSNQQFIDIITISQLTPGPLAINISTFVGIKSSGILGGVVATIGCILPGVLIAVCLYININKYKDSIWVKRGLEILQAFTLGLILAAVVSLFSSLENTGTSIVFILIILSIGLFVYRKYSINPVIFILCFGLIESILYSFF